MAECPWPVAGCAAFGWIASFTFSRTSAGVSITVLTRSASCPPSTARSSSRRRCASAMKAGSARVASKALRKAATRSAGTPGCIGILNHLFFWPEQYRRTGGMSIVFLFDENPDVASAGSGGAAVGGARSVPDHAARSNSERAAPSACVGWRLSAPQIVWNEAPRSKAPRYLCEILRSPSTLLRQGYGGFSSPSSSQQAARYSAKENRSTRRAGARGGPRVGRPR